MSDNSIINEYETTFILKSDLTEDVIEQVMEKIFAAVAKYGGEVFINDRWGNRKLAYPIAKSTNGFYIYIGFSGSAGIPSEIERIVRLDDKIIRFLTICLHQNINVEATRGAAEKRHQAWKDKRLADQEASSLRRRDSSAPSS